MSGTSNSRRAAIRGTLVERLQAAAGDIAKTITRLTTDPPRLDDPTVCAALAPIAHRLIDTAAFIDPHDGHTLDETAAILSLSRAETRRRYDSGPRELPLLVVLTEDDPTPIAPASSAQDGATTTETE